MTFRWSLARNSYWKLVYYMNICRALHIETTVVGSYGSCTEDVREDEGIRSMGPGSRVLT